MQPDGSMTALVRLRLCWSPKLLRGHLCPGQPMSDHSSPGDRLEVECRGEENVPAQSVPAAALAGNVALCRVRRLRRCDPDYCKRNCSAMRSRASRLNRDVAIRIPGAYKGT
jgi:hypothetical protein